METKEKHHLRVYYNSACPVCRAGINAQKKRIMECEIAWNDIHMDNSLAKEANPEINQVRKYLHIIDSSSQKHVGIDAFIQLWKAHPNDHWKARIISLPIIKTLAQTGYFFFAQALFTWNRLMKNWS